jgi:hypothetical protein
MSTMSTKTMMLMKILKWAPMMRIFKNDILQRMPCS